MATKLCLALGLMAGAGTALADDSPHEWLDRMASAVQTTNYAGTVIRQRQNETESLKVAHAIENGVVRERMVAQEGNGLEIVRNGNEVHCILPDKKTVLVEQWNDQSTLFSTLPDSDLRFGNEYDLVIKRRARVAGRTALELAIQPHDNYRYGHRLWLDIETAFPLKTQLIGDDGQPLEQVRFVEISMDREVAPESLTSVYETEGFTWLSVPAVAGTDRPAATADWTAAALPPGFGVVSVSSETRDDTGVELTHIMYSDGLASVSAFIEAAGEDSSVRRERLGGSNSYSLVRDDWRITVVGEVPAVTVERIAESLTLQPGNDGR